MLFYYNFGQKKYSEILSQSFGYEKDFIIHVILLFFSFPSYFLFHPLILSLFLWSIKLIWNYICTRRVHVNTGENKVFIFIKKMLITIWSVMCKSMTFGIETTAHRITLLSMHCLTACLLVVYTEMHCKMITCTRRRLCYPVSSGFYTKCHAFTHD